MFIVWFFWPYNSGSFSLPLEEGWGGGWGVPDQSTGLKKYISSFESRMIDVREIER